MEKQTAQTNSEAWEKQEGRKDWKSRTAKRDVCMDCGKEFVITWGEYMDKLLCGMRLPKRCRQCRTYRRRQRALDPYEGLSATFYWYPATKGHCHTVHGGGY